MGAKLNKKMQEQYDLTSIETADILKYMTALCKQFDTLSGAFSTEAFVKLRKFSDKKRSEKKSGAFSIIGKAIALNGDSKKLHKHYIKTKAARSLLIESLKAHKISNDEERTITEILGLMDKCGKLKNKEKTITGRHAFETLYDAHIG